MQGSFAAALVFLAATSAAAAPFTWTGAGATRSWTDAANWAGGTVPPDDGTAAITISAIGNVSLDGVRVVSSLAVSAAGDVTLRPGSQTNSALVLRGAGLSRSTRGRLTAQVPIRSAADVTLTGFESQAALSTGTVFALGTDAWAGGTTVSQAIVQATGGAVPPASALSLGAGAWLDLNGRPVAVGSLSGAGSVTNTVVGEADLIVGLDGTDTTFSGVLGAKLADQLASNNLNLLKVGAGTLTLTGTNVLGNAYARVAGGTLVVNGALVSSGGGYNYVVVASPGALRGTGTVGNIWTGYADPTGAVIAPGTAASRGVLHCSSADLTNAALQVRIAGYTIAGVDYDQLDAGAGALSFGSDTELVLDLAGLPSPPPAANKQTIVIATYGTAPTPVPAHRIRLINNPNNFGASFTYGTKSLSVTITSTPNPAPLFAVTPAHGLITAESGRSAALTVALGKQPTANVTLPVASSDTTEATVSPASLVFTPSNWATPQTVTVAGVADTTSDGNQRYSIALGPAASADPSFSNQSAPAVTGVNLDDDLITVSPVSGLISVPPPGAAPSATVSFHSPPTQDFWLALVSSDPALGWPTPGVLHVAGAGGTIPAPVQITFPGMHRLVPGCEPYTVRAVIVASGDPRYDGYQLPDIALCNRGDAAPIATADSLAVDQGSSVTVAAPGVLGNDFDADGDALAAALVTSPAHGTASLSADGTLTYTPASGYSGSDAFTYQAGDGALGSGPVTVQVTVNDLAPAATNDAYTLLGSGTLSVAAPGVLANDADPGGDVLSAQLVQTTAHGSLTLFANGSFTYVPASGFTGVDAFTYRANDGTLSSATVTVTLTVQDSAPAVAADLYAVNQGATLTIDAASGVLANDSDADGDLLAASLASGPARGALSLASDGSFIYTPPRAFSGRETFTYAATDGRLTTMGLVTIDVRNLAPAAQADGYAVDQGATLAVAAPGVLGNDGDPGGDPLSAMMVSAPAHGALSLAADGSFTYTPAAAFSGPDSFAYAASDGALSSAPVVVAISVRNLAPAAADDAYATDQGVSVDVAAPGVLANDIDPGGDPVFAVLETPPAHGALVLAADGSFSYSAEAGFSGIDAFTYRASDGALLSGPATVSLTVRNLPPLASGGAWSTTVNTPLSVAAPGVLAGATDPGSDVLSVQLVQDVAHGTLTLFANGAFAYAPGAGFTGTDSFTYRVSDGLLSSAAATVVLAVTDVPPDLARLQLTSEGGTSPGAMVAYRAAVTNLALQDLSGARLAFAPAGLAVVSATAGATPLQQEAGIFQLPTLAAGAGIEISIVAQVIASPGSRAGVAAALWTGDGRPLGTPQETYFSVGRLQFDAGGCGCRGTNAGGALAWLGAMAAFVSRRRRRTALQRPS